MFAVSKCWTGAHPTSNPPTPTVQQLEVVSWKRAMSVGTAVSRPAGVIFFPSYLPF